MKMLICKIIKDHLPRPTKELLDTWMLINLMTNLSQKMRQVRLEVLRRKRTKETLKKRTEMTFMRTWKTITERILRSIGMKELESTMMKIKMNSMINSEERLIDYLTWETNNKIKKEDSQLQWCLILEVKMKILVWFIEETEMQIKLIICKKMKRTFIIWKKPWQEKFLNGLKRRKLFNSSNNHSENS